MISASVRALGLSRFQRPWQGKIFRRVHGQQFFVLCESIKRTQGGDFQVDASRTEFAGIFGIAVGEAGVRRSCTRKDAGWDSSTDFQSVSFCLCAQAMNLFSKAA